MAAIREKIPRVQDPDTITRMMDISACRLSSLADAWHVLCTHTSGVSWAGRKIVKNQFDLARYFYLLHALRPDVVVETGLQGGGSALFFLDALRMLRLPDTLYVGVDLDARMALEAVQGHGAENPVVLVSGDCLADATLREVTPLVDGRRSLIVLDSVHSEAHVAEELRLYAPLCTAGSCLVVEDTDHGGRPILGNYGPSAAEAVEAFLAPGGLGRALGFEHDAESEARFGPFTVSPGAWLVRRPKEMP